MDLDSVGNHIYYLGAFNNVNVGIEIDEVNDETN